MPKATSIQWLSRLPTKKLSLLAPLDFQCAMASSSRK